MRATNYRRRKIICRCIVDVFVRDEFGHFKPGKTKKQEGPAPSTLLPAKSFPEKMVVSRRDLVYLTAL